MVGIYRLPMFCSVLGGSSLCTAVMPRRSPPRPGVSHALAAKLCSLRRGHANWAGARAKQIPVAGGDGQGGVLVLGCVIPGLFVGGAPRGGSIPAPSRNTMSEN